MSDRDYLFPESRCVPHYYKGTLRLQLRLAELQRTSGNMAECEEMQDTLNFVESCIEQGYYPIALVELKGAGIWYGIDLGKAVVHREWAHAYYTTRYGRVSEQVDWIVCRTLGLKDAHNCTVYETPDGVKFTIKTTRGSAENFGTTSICRPNIRG